MTNECCITGTAHMFPFLAGWPSCSVVATCTGMPHDNEVNFTLTASPAAGPVKAYRQITYTCPAGEIFDDGNATFVVPCR